MERVPFEMDRADDDASEGDILVTNDTTANIEPWVSSVTSKDATGAEEQGTETADTGKISRKGREIPP
jgi:phosphoenolpyruvate synthase/pyruvate phosphate dikinase